MNLKSIRTRIIATTLITTLLSIGFLTYYVYHFSSKVFFETIIGQHNERAYDSAVLIGETLNPLMGVVDTTVERLKTFDLTKKDELKAFMSNQILSQKSISDIYMGYESDGSFVHVADSETPAGYDPRKRFWYKQAVSENKLSVTEPYLDILTGNICISVIEPVVSDGQVKGVVGIDIMLTQLQKFISKVKVGQGGYAYIVDNNGNLVAHPKDGYSGLNLATSTDEQLAKAKIDKETYEKVLKPLWEKLKNMSSGDISYTNPQGKLVFCNISTVPNVNWKLVYVADPEEIDKQIKGILSKSVIIGLFCLLTITLLIGFITYRGLAPIGKIIESLKKMTAGDLTAKIDVTQNDEIGYLATAINELAQGSHQAMVKISESSQSIAAHSEQMSASVQEASATIEEISSTTQSVASMSQQSTTNAETTARYSEQVKNSAGEGACAVQSAVEKMSKIQGVTKGLGSTIKDLDERSQQITKVIDVISGIADQINLLSLNAAIEAARAGDAGRGFAVVADEVRKLAEQSTNSAKEIADIIEKIRVEMGKAKHGMDQNLIEVEEGVKIVNQAGMALDKIFKEIDHSVEAVKQISQGSIDTNRGTQQLAIATQQVTETIQQQASGALELAQMADDLQAMVQQFKL